MTWLDDRYADLLTVGSRVRRWWTTLGHLGPSPVHVAELECSCKEQTDLAAEVAVAGEAVGILWFCDRHGAVQIAFRPEDRHVD